MKKDDAENDLKPDVIVELTEEEEKLSKLTKDENCIIEQIESWLKTNRGYKDYDFSPEFKVNKLIPLLKLVKHNELCFEQDSITQILRNPIEMTDKAGNVIKKITEFKYKSRYQDYELQSHVRGINLEKEPMMYVNAQIAMLTNTSKSIIGKLWDIDSNNSKLISALYFLG